VSIKDTIKDVVLLPNLFNKLGNRSIYDLLKDTGYFNLFNQINEGDIKKILKKNTSCVNDWLLYSENKRTDGGYFFQKDENDKYVVSFFDSKKQKFENRKIYTDKMQACSLFIKMEIEEIRKID